MGEWDSYHITVPQRGERSNLELAQLPTSHATAGTATSVRRSSTPSSVPRLLTTMKKDLGIDRLPCHMECFDNSNIQGTNPVAACVVFKNGKPAKSEYRKFHVKTVVGADDYRTMRASSTDAIAVCWTRVCHSRPAHHRWRQGATACCLRDTQRARYLRQSMRSWSCGALRRALSSRRVGAFGLDRRSETLKVICHIRDEAHRFGITFHRDSRSKQQTKSILDDPGIGVRSKRLCCKPSRRPKESLRLAVPN